MYCSLCCSYPPFPVELPLTPGGVILLAHQTRSLRIDNILFDSLKAQGFTFSKVEEYDLHPDYKKDGVCIWKIYTENYAILNGEP